MSTTTNLDIGGVPVLVDAESDAHLCRITTRMGQIRSDRPPEFKLTIGPIEGHSVTASSTPDDLVEEVEGCTIASTDETVRITVGSRAVGLITPDGLVLRGNTSTDADLKELDDVAQYVIAAAFAGPDRMLVHGAALGRGDDAVLIVGASGRGKSTLAVAGMVDGWSLLGDDLAVLHPASGTLRSVPRPPMVPRILAEQYGLDGKVVTDKRKRVQLSADILDTDTHELRGLVIVDHDEGPGRVEPCPHDIDVFDSALAVPPARIIVQKHLRAAAALVRYPVVRIHHDADEATRIGRAQEMLDTAFELFEQA